MRNCTKYVDEIFEKKTDMVILELKKASFALENQGEGDGEGEDDSQDGEKKKKEGEEAATPADGKTPD